YQYSLMSSSFNPPSQLPIRKTSIDFTSVFFFFLL
ncbi:unnamed protein product, partial [Rotaria sp. Silwood2]